MQIQREAKHHREKYLQQKADEEEIKGNMEHARYLRMLIFIETQVEMHSTSIGSSILSHSSVGSFLGISFQSIDVSLGMSM